jgi:hypothetical protein
MNHPLEWEINYCLTTIDNELDRTDAIEKKLYENPQQELTFEEGWAIRETLRRIRHEVSMLQVDIKELNDNPPKKNFITKLMRK